MKKAPLILSISALIVAIAAFVFILVSNCPSKSAKSESTTSESVTAQAGDIVYVRIDSLIVQYDMFNDLRTAFEDKAQKVQEDLSKRGRKLESDVKSFENSINKGLLTRSTADQQQQALIKRQNDLQTLAQQKQNELQEEEFVLNNQVMDAIQTFLTTYNISKGYSLIFTTSAQSNTIIIGDNALDITQDVVEGLNQEYVKNRNK